MELKGLLNNLKAQMLKEENEENDENEEGQNDNGNADKEKEKEGDGAEKDQMLSPTSFENAPRNSVVIKGK